MKLPEPRIIEKMQKRKYEMERVRMEEKASYNYSLRKGPRRPYYLSTGSLNKGKNLGESRSKRKAVLLIGTLFPDSATRLAHA
jgi:hypothetical protein